MALAILSAFDSPNLSFTSHLETGIYFIKELMKEQIRVYPNPIDEGETQIVECKGIGSQRSEAFVKIALFNKKLCTFAPQILFQQYVCMLVPLFHDLFPS